MNFLRKAWRGEAKLWQVYWLLGFIGWGITARLWMFGYTTLAHDNFNPYVFMLPIAAGTLVMSVLIWKNAFNCQWRGWGILARVIAVLAALYALSGPIQIKRELDKQHAAYSAEHIREAP